MRGSVGMNNKMKFLCVPVLLVHAAGFQIVDHFEDYDPFLGGKLRLQRLCGDQQEKLLLFSKLLTILKIIIHLLGKVEPPNIRWRATREIIFDTA